MKEMVTLSQMELKRMLVLQRVLEGQISTFEAALILGLSERQVYRLKTKFQSQGPAALVHGNRGRKPVHAVPEETRQQVIQLAQTIYRRCNYTFLSELLCEREGITLSPSSVGRILKSAGIPSPRKHRPPKLHRRRQRKPQFGMLVLIDGSHHDWLEGRGPKLVLLLAVDDATSMILAALFSLSEDFEGYRRLLFDLVTRYGIPLAIYSDRHTLFFPPEKEVSLEQQLLGEVRPLTQIGRILNELGITHIPARSPQAKGRVERAFGTLQERLTVELRLAGACSLEEANEILGRFIERYNRQFAVPPESSASAFRPVPAHLRLEHVFCWKEHRVLNPGYTIQYQKQTYRVVNTKGVPAIPLRTVVEVHGLADGNLFVGWNGHIYLLEPVPASSLSPKNKEAKKKGGQSMGRKPAPAHPWRKPWKSSQINHGVSF